MGDCAIFNSCHRNLLQIFSYERFLFNRSLSIDWETLGRVGSPARPGGFLKHACVTLRYRFALVSMHGSYDWGVLLDRPRAVFPPTGCARPEMVNHNAGAANEFAAPTPCGVLELKLSNI